jgi:hypothetical protein
MPSLDVSTILARLNEMQAQLQAERPPRPRHRPGRPNSGIRSGFTRTEVYLSPAVRDDLDRLAGKTRERTGQTPSRAVLIRAAIEHYLRVAMEGGG